jgi:hypothetical protein
MLTAIADRLWVAEQPLRFYGLPIFSRMTVIALPNQDLIATLLPQISIIICLPKILSTTIQKQNFGQ